MMLAHFKPSDEIIKRIGNTIRCYHCKGNVEDFKTNRLEICKAICNEAGIENPTNEDLLSALPAFNYHAQKFTDKFLTEKYKGVECGEN